MISWFECLCTSYDLKVINYLVKTPNFFDFTTNNSNTCRIPLGNRKLQTTNHKSNIILVT